MIDDELAKVYVEKIILQRYQIGLAVGVSRHLLERAKVTTMMDLFADKMVMALKTYLEVRAHESKAANVEFYATWWDHFKAEAMPRRLRRFFAPPAKRVEVVFQPKSVYVCPHANIAWPKQPHIEWLMRTEP